MRLTITCYKEDSGKFYSEDEVTVPDMSFTTEVSRILDIYATRDYVIEHHELWPVINLDSYHTTITLIEEDTGIEGVPIMIPARFQANRKPHVPL